jgi:phage baseplate assembly protein W
MIPNINELLSTTLELETQPSKNFKMYFAQEVVSGTITDLNAMEQVIYKILNTERYQYLIYSWNYGIELNDLLGEPVSYVCPEIERKVTEALVQDDRILSVDSFVFDTTEKRKVHVTFTVHTIFGDVNAEKVVNY